MVLADNLSSAADYFYNLEFYNQALEYSVAANEIYTNLDQLKAAETFTMISLIYDCFGDYPNGAEASHSALEIYQDLNDSSGVAYSYNDIAVFHYYNGEYDMALDYLEQAHEYFSTLDDQSGMSMYYNNTANILFDQDDLEGALEFNIRAYKLNSAE